MFAKSAMQASVKRPNAVFGVMLAGTVLAGCNSATQVHDIGQTQLASYVEGEAVVFLSKPQLATSETDAGFIACVGNALAKQDAGIPVIPQQQFIDGMYPFFEARTAPTSVQGLARLMGEPAVRDRLAEMNIRYLVWLDGNTETVDKSGPFSCAVGPGGGGCIGWTQWKDQGSYEATIWDLKEQGETGSFNIESSGTSHLVGLIVPVPLLARVESDACMATAQRIALAMKNTEAPSILRR